MVGIYSITSPSGKIYIGQSWNLHKRILSYKRLDCKQQPKIYRSLLKYGVENHEFSICKGIPEITTQKQLDFWEDYCICCFSRLGVVMLNIKAGGSGGRMAEESKLKLSLLRKGVSRPEMTGDKNPYFGKKHSDEIRLKMSKSNKGKKTGDKNGRARKIAQYSLDGCLIKEYPTIIESAKEVGISRQGISDCLNGRNKTASGFKWAYIN